MKFPICTFCLKTGVLCVRCQEKLARGEVTELDLRVAKVFLELENRFPILKDIQYHKAFQHDNFTVILISGAGNTLKPLWLRIARALGEKLGGEVRIVEKTSNLKLLVEQVITPCRLLGVNTLWLPDGTEENTIRVPRFDRRRLPARQEVLEDMIKAGKASSKISTIEFSTDKPVKIDFELPLQVKLTYYLAPRIE